VYSGDEELVFAPSTDQPLNHRNVAKRGFEAAPASYGTAWRTRASEPL